MSAAQNLPKRWTLREDAFESHFMVESDSGEYVLHSDYAALAAERDALKAERDAWMKAANSFTGTLTGTDDRKAAWKYYTDALALSQSKP